MNNPRSVSLKLYLPLLFSLSFLLLWGGITWQLYNRLETELVNSHLNIVHQDSADLQLGIDQHIIENELTRIGQDVSNKGVNPNYTLIVTTDENALITHATRYSLRDKLATNAVPEFDPLRFTRAKNSNHSDIQVSAGRQEISAYVPITLKRKPNELRSLKAGILFIIYDLGPAQTALKDYVLESSLTMAASLLVMLGLLSLLFNRFLTQPIGVLIRNAKNLAKDETRAVMRIDGHGELAQLGDEFNTMAAHLRQRTEQRELAEAALRKNDEILNSVLEGIPDLLFVIDSEGLIKDYHASHANDLYVDPSYFLGKSMVELLPSDVASVFADNMSLARQQDEATSFDYALNTPSGNNHYEARLNFLPSHQLFVAIVRNITERKSTELKVLHQAHYDALTDLPNRFLALERLNYIVGDAKRNASLVAVLFIDLDDFKIVNDSLGHEVGDKLLIEAAHRLNSVVRSNDTAGRLGGDEFIVLLTGLTQAADVLPVVEHLIARFREPFLIDERELHISCSVGIAIYPNDGMTPSTLLRNADSSMYHAKAMGRDTFAFFTDEMNAEVSRRLDLEEQIRGALEREEFEVYYQPQVNCADGHITGAEALLRWNNHKLGAVSPDEFIPVAEQTGLILPIGQFVLSQALAVSAQWQKEYASDLIMSVNISPIQFRDGDLIDFVRQALDKAGVAPHTLELEITEGVLMSGQAGVDVALEELSAMGISIAMDDFGTGYSSLSYLRNYPFDMLKIDRSFTREICSKHADKQLVLASIVMAHSLDIKVVAEGVETQAQFDVLKELACDYCQGYLFGKPVPAERLFDTPQETIKE